MDNGENINMAIAKLNNLNPEIALQSFAYELGKDFDKIVNDVRAMLGRLNEKELKSEQGDWKAGAKFKLTSKEGYSVQLPPNNPAAILLCFGMRINELASAGVFDIQATIPKNCQDWVAQHRKTAEVFLAQALKVTA